MRKILFFIISFLLLLAEGCSSGSGSPQSKQEKNLPDRFLVVLGISQDAGYPQIGCARDCCKLYCDGKEKKRLVTCLALVDRNYEKMH